jgi:hypothetical protein
MRTHTTLTLRRLIVNDMDVNNCTLNKQQIDVWIQTLPEITGEMFETIYFFTHSLFSKGMVGRQIRQIHRECITLLDKIDKYQDLPPGLDALKSSAIKCLDAVMEKIETDCGNYLESTVLMPVIHLRREQVGIESCTLLITAQLKNLNTPVKLQSLVLECMTDLQKAARCYYYRMNYVKKLQHNLVELCKKSNKDCIEYQLTALLISTNYNSGNFIKYYQQKLMDELGACIGEQEQMKYLHDLEREFARDPYRKSSLSYDVKRKRVKHLLAELVETELKIRQKKAALNRPVPISSYQTNQQVKLAPANYKIRTNLTVDALAYFLKLMIKAKVIDAGIRSELMAFVAASFQTPGTSSLGISPGSLETKYKQVVQSTARQIRAVLMNMVKILDEEFGVG